jgi:site-specific DNA recombinase
MKDFRYYRCSGTDPYRFGGERICSNRQIQADKVEAAIWNYVCGLLKNPKSLEKTLGREDRSRHNVLPEDVDALRAQRQKLQHGMERLIDTLAEGVIDKDQFTLRMNRAKARVADLDAKITSQATDEDRGAYIHLVMSCLTELSRHMKSQLKKPDWATKREIIRAVVQRIEIGPMNIAIVLRLPTEKSVRVLEPIIVTLSRA